MTMIASPEPFRKYTMGFDTTITPDQKKNLENVAAQLARKHEASTDDIAISYIEHTNTFVFETKLPELFDAACKAFNELEPSLKVLQTGAVISNSRIRKAGTDKKEEASDVTYLRQVALHDAATEQPKYMDFIKRAIEYYLKTKLQRSKEDLSIDLQDNVIQIRAKSVPDGDVMQIIFKSFADDPRFTILDNQQLSRLYTLTRSHYTAETKRLARNPAAKPAETGVVQVLPTHFEEMEFNRNDIPGLKALKSAFSSGKRSTTQTSFQLAAFGNASFKSEPRDQFIRVSLPVFSDPARTELVKIQIVKGLNRLAHLAQIGQLRQLDQSSVTKAFAFANKDDLAKASGSTSVVINHALNAKKSVAPKAPEYIQFTLPRIDEKNQLKSGEDTIGRFSSTEINFIKALNDRAVVMSMDFGKREKEEKDEKEKRDPKIRAAAYQALDGLKRKKYHKLVVAGTPEQFNHMRDVVEEIDFLLGHGDMVKGRGIRDKLSDEKRIEITDTPFQPGEEYRQACILLNGAQDYSYEQLVEITSKLPDASTTTVTFIGTDKKYNDLVYASNYKFFFDTLTKDPRYSRMVAGFLPEEQEGRKHPLIEMMLLNGHNKPPHIISQTSSLAPSPEQK